MQRAKVLNIIYEDSDTMACQGTRSKIEKYRKQGYYPKIERNGYWVLLKPARAIIVLESEAGEKNTFNIKEDILNYYDAKRISQKLVDKFVRECQSGNIKFYTDGENYTFK